MAILTFAIAPDEFLGLSALAELGRTADAGQPSATADAITDADVVGQARTLMPDALADKLTEANLSWAPSAEAVFTLWDWLQMLLVPLVFPTIVLPFLLDWISGNAAQRATMAHEAPVVPPAAAVGGATRWPTELLKCLGDGDYRPGKARQGGPVDVV